MVDRIIKCVNNWIEFTKKEKIPGIFIGVSMILASYILLKTVESATIRFEGKSVFELCMSSLIFMLVFINCVMMTKVSKDSKNYEGLHEFINFSKKDKYTSK